MEGVKYKRVLLKISGEICGGKDSMGIALDSVMKLAVKIKKVHDMGVQVGVVIGGGNIFRWRYVREAGMGRNSADTMGMMATIINGLALQDSLERLGVDTRLMTAISMPEVAEPYIIRKARSHLDKGRITIFAGGVGGPYFTTDSAAALRALETNAEIILKASNVDGVYSEDPNKNAKAIKYEELSFKEALEKDLNVMDMTAFALCKDNGIPVRVFKFNNGKNLVDIVKGENIGTLVR